MIFSTRTIEQHEKILKKVTDYEIFCKYFPMKIGNIYHSPFREDNKPSFSFYIGANGTIRYKDFSTGETGSCFDFVSKLYGLSYIDTCKKIAFDFNLDGGKEIITSKENNTKVNHEFKNKEKAKIEYTTKPFSELELNWWKLFSISKKTLEYFNVYSGKRVFINDKLWRISTDKEPIYIYKSPKTGNCKIYRPFSTKKDKWRTNATNTEDIGGYWQLPDKGDLIFLTKSLKDCMVLYELGYNAVATQGEGHNINPDFFRHLRGRFNNIIILYDNDAPGIMAAKNLAKRENLKYIITKNAKDISDYISEYGFSAAKELIKTSING